jgi:hypothetical protein
MRRLTVKNFSVISQSELELGKVSGRIGPQSNGKSRLSNLAYFLTKQKIEFALATILSAKLADRDKFDDLKATLSRDFLAWSPFPTWHRSHASLGFGSHSDWVRVFATNEFEGVVFECSRAFENTFRRMFELVRSFAWWSCWRRQGGRASYLELNRFESMVQSVRLDFLGRN